MRFMESSGFCWAEGGFAHRGELTMVAKPFRACQRAGGVSRSRNNWGGKDPSARDFVSRGHRCVTVVVPPRVNQRTLTIATGRLRFSSHVFHNCGKNCGKPGDSG